ncbi:hypothetical protein EDB85DRAFT_1897435 [Lactarius pseudohatsudake]|nr:hypothetical protein EDB85DRAFT_1897435 [Lactarius pseudohatsudake]
MGRSSQVNNISLNRRMHMIFVTHNNAANIGPMLNSRRIQAADIPHHKVRSAVSLYDCCLSLSISGLLSNLATDPFRLVAAAMHDRPSVVSEQAPVGSDKTKEHQPVDKEVRRYEAGDELLVCVLNVIDSDLVPRKNAQACAAALTPPLHDLDDARLLRELAPAHCIAPAFSSFSTRTRQTSPLGVVVFPNVGKGSLINTFMP